MCSRPIRAQLLLLLLLLRGRVLLMTCDAFSDAVSEETEAEERRIHV